MISQEVRCVGWVGYGESAELLREQGPWPSAVKGPHHHLSNPFVVPHVEQPERCV